MPVPNPTTIFRIIHIDNLHVYLSRGTLHAPNHTPDDGLGYNTIHNLDIQNQRRITNIPCGEEGVVHDYLSFYFGPLSPMLLNLHTGRVPEYNEGQEPIIYLVSTVERIQDLGESFVFSDGHGIAAFTRWFDDVRQLRRVDWDMVNQRYWSDTVEDMDRQRRKQAEFLVHQSCRWEAIIEIGVLNNHMRTRVQGILNNFDDDLHRDVNIHPEWYYYN